MHPGLESGIEELQPLMAYVEHDRITQEEMLQAETGSNAAEVEQVSAAKNIHQKLRVFIHLFIANSFPKLSHIHNLKYNIWKREC